MITNRKSHTGNWYEIGDLESWPWTA